jgi:3-hydroxybutyryl-CoA dehydrogenase/5-formyl-3-hydroxy-2-methylpyridine 4-carboxylate dehydrogenase
MAKAAVIGLGTMGPGIAATLLRGGLTVSAFDSDSEKRSRASAAIAAALNVLHDLEVPDRAAGRSVAIADNLAACVADADLVLESVPERLQLKSEIFKAVEPLVGRSCVLASDTSGIRITKLQESIAAPHRFVGMHWSNPPHIIPVIEVIAGAQTSTDTVAWMVETIKRLNVLPVVVKKDVPGFVENRILYAIMREAIDLVEKGVIDAEALDACVSWSIGYKLSVVGPMALLDMAGLDVYEAVGSYLNKELCNRDDVGRLVTDRTAAGRLGIKSGAGIFDYTAEGSMALAGTRARKLVAVRKALDAAIASDARQD